MFPSFSDILKWPIKYKMHCLYNHRSMKLDFYVQRNSMPVFTICILSQSLLGSYIDIYIYSVEKTPIARRNACGLHS